MTPRPRRSIARSVLVLLAPAPVRSDFARELDAAFEAEAAHRGWWFQRWWNCEQALKGVAPMLRLRSRVNRAAAGQPQLPGGRLTHGGPHLQVRATLQDIRFGVRNLRAHPGFTAVIITTLALGIGANTAIFSVVHSVLIRELPYPDPARLVRIYETFGGNRHVRGVANPYTYDVWERQTRSFSGLSAMEGGSATLTGAGDPERVRVYGVTASFFDIMGRQAALGRVLSADDADAARPVIVISHGLWQRRFGRDPNVIGRTVQLDGDWVSVVGVLESSFAIPENCDVWRPYVLTPKARAVMGSWFLGVIGRLAPGVTIDQAQAELDAISAQLTAQFPTRRKGRGAWVVGLQEDLGFRVEEALWLLQGVVGIVLLVACANVANLLVASASGRRRELSIRASLGAGRLRLIRQIVTESVLVAVVGGLAGAVIAAWGVPVLVANAPEYTLPANVAIGVSPIVLALTLGVSVLTGIVSGIAPALLFSRPATADSLRGASTNVAGPGTTGQRWLRFGLVAGEVALAIVLVTGSALLIRSFARLTRQPTGFSPERLITATISLPERSYGSPAAQQRFWGALFERLRATPGAIDAGASTALPFSNWEWQTWFEVRGREDVKNDGTSIRTVTPGYFNTLGLPLLSGRLFSDGDVSGADPVIIVNEAFARVHLPGMNPIGQQVRTERPGGGAGTTQLIGVRSELAPSARWMTVVGVVGDIRHTALDDAPQPEIYRPLAQWATGMMVVAVRTASDPEPLGARLRQHVHDIDPSLAVEQVRTMQAAIDRTVARRRFEMWLFSLFGTLGGVLAAIGIYGVMSYVAGLRRREMGIRLALGARPSHVKLLVTRQGLRPVVAGLAIGLTSVWWLSALLESRLFGVTPHDPASLASTAIGFLVVALLACWVPARRAGKADPVAILRSE
jgi:putative ABC transport system permease protein